MGSRALEINYDPNDLSLSITTSIPCCHVLSRFPDIWASFPIPDYTVLQWPPTKPSSKLRVKSNFQGTNTNILNPHATKSKNHPHLHRNNIGWIEGSVIFCLFLAPRVSSYFKFKERFQDMERRKKNESFSNLIESNVRHNWKMDNDGLCTFTGVNYL
jgi:hypothetical protein